MKFRRRQVADQAAQENFDQLQTMFPLGVTDLATGILLELAATGTARKVAFGVSTLTWPGATTLSTTLTVTHGLGRAPVNVQATAAGIYGEALCPEAGSYTATTFALHAQFVAGFAPAAASTFQVAWLAIG